MQRKNPKIRNQLVMNYLIQAAIITINKKRKNALKSRIRLRILI